MHWGKIYKFDSISADFNVYEKDQELQVLMELCLSFSSSKINNKPLTVVGNGKQTRELFM